MRPRTTFILSVEMVIWYLNQMNTSNIIKRFFDCFIFCYRQVSQPRFLIFYLFLRALRPRSECGRCPRYPGSPAGSSPAGRTAPNPAELLQDARLKRLLEEAKQEYDYIILEL